MARRALHRRPCAPSSASATATTALRGPPGGTPRSSTPATAPSRGRSEYGGRDAGLDEQLVYNEEMARAGAPGPVNAIGVANIAPAIMTYGTAEQQERFLRPMLRGDEIWSQGMSEPDAGSDLASLRCRGRASTATTSWSTARRRGTRTATGPTGASSTCAPNTDVPKHKGITCLLVDMRTPGIEARPIATMAGDTSFSELFFTDARVPPTGPARRGRRRAGAWPPARSATSGPAWPACTSPSGASSTGSSRRPRSRARRHPPDRRAGGPGRAHGPLHRGPQPRVPGQAVARRGAERSRRPAPRAA